MRRQIENAHTDESLQRTPRVAGFAHKSLDAAVTAAYGWPVDLTDEQVLERLLALNLKRAAEEAEAAKSMKPKTSREKHGDELL